MSIEILTERLITRRQAVSFGSTALLAIALFGLPVTSAEATPKQAKNRLSELTKGAERQKGRVHITLPKLTQDGKRTRIKVAIDSPMTDDDFVRSLHIVAERNTYPDIASYELSPLSGKAEIVTRIRIAKSQTIIVAAEMNDGSVYYAKARCKVARGAGGCG